MVSAVHRWIRNLSLINYPLQRGCTWLVQFIFSAGQMPLEIVAASKGLHIVSAVHHRRLGNSPFSARFKGAAHG